MTYELAWRLLSERGLIPLESSSFEDEQLRCLSAELWALEARRKEIFSLIRGRVVSDRKINEVEEFLDGHP